MWARANAPPFSLPAPSGGDRIAAGLRVAQLLNTASLDAGWMAPGATLILRKFTDPLPGRLCREKGARVVSPEWDNAAQSALRSEFQRAVRPVREIVTAGTNAVLFDTDADLLACLVRDLCNGEAFVRWWWKSFVRGSGASLGAALTAAFRRQPRHVPAAMAKLAEWSQTERVVAQLSTQQAELILAEVLHVYGLPGVAAELRPQAGAAFEVTRQEDASTCNETSCFTVDAAVVALPWEPFVEAKLTPAYLEMPRRALIGITLLLARAPHRGRTAALEQGVRRWAMLGLRASAGAAMDTPLAGENAQRVEDGPAFRKEAIAGEKDQSNIPRPAPPWSAAKITVLQTAAEAHIAQQSRSAPIAEPEFPATDSDESPSIEFDLHAGVATQLGGALFLIPCFRALDFFASLESEFGLEIASSPWAMVEVFTRCLLGKLSPGQGSDPMWAALRSLDDRPLTEAPARGFTGVAEYRLPSAWLRARGAGREGLLSVSSRGGRLLVRHPQGFPLLDRTIAPSAPPVSQLSLRQIAEEFPGSWRFGKPDRDTQRTISRLSRGAPLEWRSNRQLCRFLNFLSPFFRWSLANALTIPRAPGMRTKEDPVAALIRRPGRLYITSTHVDLVMDMRSVTLGARLAGLDANPGWVPELGRVVTFHYR